MKMKFDLDFYNGYTDSLNNYAGIFKRLTAKTFKHLNITGYYLVEVNLIDSAEIQDVNKEYRGIDAPTDVISFALRDKVVGEVNIIQDNDTPILLGSILIAVDVAMNQAEQYNHDLRRELKFLYLHGLLHLLGYDHNNEEEEKKMFGLQDEILGKRKEKNNEQ